MYGGEHRRQRRASGGGRRAAAEDDRQWMTTTAVQQWASGAVVFVPVRRSPFQMEDNGNGNGGAEGGVAVDGLGNLKWEVDPLGTGLSGHGEIGPMGVGGGGAPPHPGRYEDDEQQHGRLQEEDLIIKQRAGRCPKKTKG
nr:hypothetical protein Iba_chr06aCG13600 [Ipomoea batatas]